MSNIIEIDPELQAQITGLSKVVHDLLDGPNGDGQLTGKMERQRVVLEVPRAFVVLATFLATFDPKKNEPNGFWRYVCDEGQSIDDPKVRRMMRRVLERVLENAMHDQLHLVATHWFLTEPDGVPSETIFIEASEPAEDDEMPF